MRFSYYKTLIEEERTKVARVLHHRFKDNPPYILNGFGAKSTEGIPMIYEED